ncbi:galactoside alpha-(1,2)-fucosyltransferase 2-like [Saccostrea echinata]|uniref:galactoside alpha-(1,2)-fucosyltransferase 2-like n=1 Tax=Saccostrea echinata TaxID=191078 RepID=UPI002A7F4809|nr:galactoside alpha-(1,2)-fucosyltransferase 2-like [Saccostrea echinata]
MEMYRQYVNGVLLTVYLIVILGILQHLLITRKYPLRVRYHGVETRLNVKSRSSKNNSIHTDINFNKTTQETVQKSTSPLRLKTTFIKSNAQTSSTALKNCTIEDTPTVKSVSSSTYFPKKEPKFLLCVGTRGRLGNHMFEFASGYGIAAKKNMVSVIKQRGLVDSVFELKNDSHLLLVPDLKACKGIPRRYERWCSRYDPQLENFTVVSNIFMGWGLQSWKYFNDSSQNLRKQMTFRKHIRQKVTEIQERTWRKFNFTSRSDVTFIGVHIRRGDMLNNPLGYDVATPEYISRAVEFFKKYKNTIFLVCSMDLTWSQKYMPKNVRVEFSVGNTPEVDMALLASSDHVIQTVGTFGWWSSWLNNGTVIYYKWPAKEDGKQRSTFSADYSDFFLPSWIGM